MARRLTIVFKIFSVNLWKCHRKVLLPVFHNKIVEEYIGVIAEQADVLVERLSEQNGQKEFDVLKYITACTLDIVFGKLIHSHIVIKMNKRPPPSLHRDFFYY